MPTQAEVLREMLEPYVHLAKSLRILAPVCSVICGALFGVLGNALFPNAHIDIAAHEVGLAMAFFGLFTFVATYQSAPGIVLAVNLPVKYRIANTPWEPGRLAFVAAALVSSVVVLALVMLAFPNRVTNLPASTSILALFLWVTLIASAASIIYGIARRTARAAGSFALLCVCAAVVYVGVGCETILVTISALGSSKLPFHASTVALFIACCVFLTVTTFSVLSTAHRRPLVSLIGTMATIGLFAALNLQGLVRLVLRFAGVHV